jgi:hypothetical protein
MTTDILRNTLETICDLANEYLENIDRRGDAWVTLTSMVDHSGALNPGARDKIVMCVYNITRESTISTYQTSMSAGQIKGQIKGSSDSLAVVAPPLYLDVHMMFMANFMEKNYADGLSALSRLIGYFQQTPLFDRSNAPALAPEIDKLTLEFENLSPVDVNYVMGMLGTRYFPSAFYKLRMLSYVSTAMQSRTYPVSGTGQASPP